jgi:hypothetical protein
MAVVRTFKPYSCSQVAQPLVGSAFQQQVVGNDLVSQTAVVSDSSMFQNNDTIFCMPATGGTATELAIQIQVPSATTITGIFKKNHAVGEFAVLSWPCQNIQVQAVVANPLTSSLFLGVGKNPPTTAAVNAFHDLNLTLYYSGPPGFTDGDNLGLYWIVAAGTTTQFYLPSCVQS